MGGKRPDQYQIDPGEAGSTDYKFLEPDEGIKTAEKHELASNAKADEADHGLIPVTHQNPAAAKLRERKALGGREDTKGNGSGKGTVGKSTKTLPSSRGKETKARSSKHSGQAKARTAKSKGKRSKRGG